VVQTYLNNHLKLKIYYHSERVSGGNASGTSEVCRIVAFEIYPQR